MQLRRVVAREFAAVAATSGIPPGHAGRSTAMIAGAGGDGSSDSDAAALAGVTLGYRELLELFTGKARKIVQGRHFGLLLNALLL